MTQGNDADVGVRGTAHTDVSGNGQGDRPRLQGVRNFRDLGGIPARDGLSIRHGRLFRSGHLANATPADAAALASANLRVIFDLRNDADIDRDGSDVTVPGARTVSLALVDPAHGVDISQLLNDGGTEQLRALFADGGAAAIMTEVYRSEVTRSTDAHARFLRQLCAPEGTPALIHCSAGKDRAGWAVALVLLALGVSEDEAMADYLASNDPSATLLVPVLEQAGVDPAGRAELNELLRPVLEARPEYLRGALDAVHQTWGDFATYLSEGLDFGPRRQELLREQLLTEP